MVQYYYEEVYAFVYRGSERKGAYTMKRILKKAASAAISMMMLCGAVPALPFAELQAPAVRAEAAESENECWYDAGTKTLHLAGDVQNIHGEKVGDSGIVLPENADQKTIEHIIAEPGTVLPQDCYGLFHNKINLKDCDLSHADTSNVTNMSYMFYYCQNLTSLDLSGFDTSNVTNMSYMFSMCSWLTSLDLRSFDTSNVTDMGYMFAYCTRLKSLGLRSFDTSNVKNMRHMFNSCGSLISLNLSSFDTSNVTDMCYMFGYCRNLTSLDLSSFDTSNVTDMSFMFYDCTSLTSLDVSGFDTSKVTNMSQMFSTCRNLTSLDVSGFDTSNVTDMSFMFWSCQSLTSLDLSNFDTSNVMDMSNMFSFCTRLTSLDVSGFDTSNVTSMRAMFYSCNNLISLDLSSFDTSKESRYMFYDCSVLKTIYVSEKWNTSSVSDSLQMFTSCNCLVGGNGTEYNESYTDKEYACLDGKDGKPGYLTFKGSRVKGGSLALSNRINVRLYANLDDKAVKAVLTGPAGKVTFTDLESLKDQDGDCKFTYDVNALQADKDITLKIYDAAGNQLDLYNSNYEKMKGGAAKYSVNTYIADSAKYQDDAKKTALVAALDNYCKAAENFFLQNNHTITGIDNVKKSSFSSYAPTLCGNKIALVLNSGIAVRIYTDAPTASYNGNALTKNTQKGYFEIPNIAASNLSRTKTVTVGSDTLTFSPLSYGYLAMNTNDSSLKTLVRALYVYAQAAADYAA